eukprot:GSChrysophyteH1.ASY1.ANO1.975.1 assembled CDS
MGDLIDTLRDAAGNPDHDIRTAAMQKLETAESGQYVNFMVALCTEFASEDKPMEGRQLSGLYLKNMISAQDEAILEMKLSRWQSCDPATKEGARQAWLTALMSPVKAVCHTSAQVLAAYGKVDLPKKEFPSLLPTLKQCVESEVSDINKIAALECMGYLCDAMDPDEDDIPKENVDMILTAIVNGMHESRSIEMRIAATKALQNTLVFASANFEDPSGVERNMIMESIRSAMVCQEDEKIRELAYQCLPIVAECYYDFIDSYIETIYGLSIQAIQSDSEEVGIQAIEFWIVLCETEIDRDDDLANGMDASEVKHKYIMKKVTPTLLPVILGTFTKMDEDDDDEDQRISYSGHLFLEKLSLCVTNDVVALVLPYVQQHIQNPDWRFRDSAVSAFGFILDGPSSEVLHPIIQQAANTLINLTQDVNEHVAESALWTLAKICEYHKVSIPPPAIQPLVQAVITSLGRESVRVQSKACLAIHNLALACEEAADMDTNLLSQFFEQVIPKILEVSVRYANDEKHQDNALNAYEAVNMMVQNSAKDMLPAVLKVLNEGLDRLEQVSVRHQGSLSPQSRMSLHGHLATLVGACVQKLEKDAINPYADRIMTALLAVVQDTTSTALQDAFMTMGYMIDRLEGSFERYASSVMPILFDAMDRHEDFATCHAAIGVFGDIARSLGQNIIPYCDQLIQKSFTLLQSTSVEKVLKPNVISLFSDVAMAIEGKFERYAETVLSILGKAVESAKLSKDKQDEDHDEFVYTIQEAIIDAYTGIIYGLSAENKQDTYLAAHIQTILTFVLSCTYPYDDVDRPTTLFKNCVGILGDLAKAFGNKIAAPLHHQKIQELVNAALQHEDESVKDTGKWVRNEITSILTPR